MINRWSNAEAAAFKGDLTLVVLSFQEGSFYGRQANAPAAREAILEAATARLGARPELEIRFDAEGHAMQERTVAAVEKSRRKGRK